MGENALWSIFTILITIFVKHIFNFSQTAAQILMKFGSNMHMSMVTEVFPNQGCMTYFHCIMLISFWVVTYYVYLQCITICLFVFYIPSIARSFGDGIPIYCPLRRTWSSVNTPFPLGIEPGVIAWQSITLPLRHASSTQCITIWHYVIFHFWLLLNWSTDLLRIFFFFSFFLDLGGAVFVLYLFQAVIHPKNFVIFLRKNVLVIQL